MQEFENGALVTVTYAESGNTGDCKHVGMNGLLHVVDLGNHRLCEFGDDYIRPRQLICDEVREKLKDLLLNSVEFKIRLEDHSMLAELSELTQCTYSASMVSNLLFFTSGEREISHCSDDIKYFDSYKCPELNLKTGVVTPCEGDGKTREEVTNELVAVIGENRKLRKQNEVHLNQIKRQCIEIEELLARSVVRGIEIIEHKKENNTVKQLCSEYKEIADNEVKERDDHLLLHAEDKAEIELLTKRSQKWSEKYQDLRNKANQAQNLLIQGK